MKLGRGRFARWGYAHRGTRGWLKPTLLIVLALAVVLVIDAVWAGLSTANALRSTRNDLQRGGDALRAGDVQAAAQAMQEAQDSAASATDVGWHPSVVVAGWLPWIGDDVQAVRSLSQAALHAADAGVAVSQAALATGWDGQSVPGLDAGGSVDLETIETAAPSLEQAAADLAEAAGELEDIDVDGLVEPVATGVSKAREELADQGSLITTARDLGRLLPGMLGGDGPRRYLLAFQNLSAPRGTGGYLGFYGVLAAEDGQITLEELRPVGDVERVAPVDVPSEVARRYGPFGVRSYLLASNYSPDVPASSDVALEIAREAGIGDLDGVVWTDTQWFSDVLDAVGPVQSSGWPEPITADNVVDVLNRQIFEGTDPVASDAAQAQIGLDVWNAVLTRAPEPTAMTDAMSRGVDEGHFVVFSRDPVDQEVLDDLGATGRFALGPNPLAVIWQDASSTRAGFFAERSVSSKVTLDASGVASVSTVVALKNGAPTGPPSILLGTPGQGVPVGWWGVDTELYLPEGATRIEVKTSEPSVYAVSTAFGHPVADAFLFADPGEQMAATTTYRQPGAAANVEGTWTYSVQVRPQASLRPIPYTLEIRLPEGASVTASSSGVLIDGGVARWSGEPVMLEEVWVSYSLGG